MKLFSKLLFVFSLVLALHATDNSISYNEAIKLYKTKQFKASYNAFTTLREKDEESVEINYYFARSAFHTKNYTQAITAYKKILQLQPNNVKVKLELGRSFFILNEYEQAKLYFYAALEVNLLQIVRDKV